MTQLSKKYSIMLAATLGLATVALTGIATVSANSQTVSADQAQEIALQDAGLTVDQVDALKVSSDEDNDRPVYEIEFKHHGSEYDYTVSATDGHITEKDTDIDDGSGNVSSSSTKTEVTADEAKALALKDAGLTEAEVTKLKVKTDQDNNRPVFEIEFEKGQTDYDYTVDASSGQITEKDID